MLGLQNLFHKCTQCIFGSGQQTKVLQHMKNVHNSKELYIKGHMCRYQSASKLYLEEHIQVEHSKSVQICDICDFKSKRKHIIRKHVLIVHQGVELKCRLCPFIHTSLDAISSHGNLFHSQKLCKMCHKIFKGVISLNAHKVKDHELKIHGNTGRTPVESIG